MRERGNGSEEWAGLGTRTVRRVALIAGALLLVSAIGLAFPGRVDAAARTVAVKSASGDFAAFVRAFEAAIPRRGTEGYDIPTASERDGMASAWAAVLSGDLARAATIADRYGFDIVRFSDTGVASPRPLVLLKERARADGTFPHAWGMYALATGTPVSVVVEVTHPVFDVNTAAMGVATFRRSQGAFFMAGAHRYANADGSADVAHRADSVFEAIHRRTVRTGVRVYQPHGFDAADFDTSYGEAVVSRGDRPSDLTLAVASGLTTDGFSVCLYDGATRCRQLAATTNVQGSSARSVGAEFVHVEVARSVRDDAARRGALDATVGRVLAN